MTNVTTTQCAQCSASVKPGYMFCTVECSLVHQRITRRARAERMFPAPRTPEQEVQYQRWL